MQYPARSRLWIDLQVQVLETATRTRVGSGQPTQKQQTIDNKQQTTPTKRTRAFASTRCELTTAAKGKQTDEC
jgi:hypothetical protein